MKTAQKETKNDKITSVKINSFHGRKQRIFGEPQIIKHLPVL